jgi:apoptosis-inducing factor 2
MQFVPIGASQGVGIAFGWKLPSFAVKFAKSKDFMIGNLDKVLAGTW